MNKKNEIKRQSIKDVTFSKQRKYSRRIRQAPYSKTYLVPISHAKKYFDKRQLQHKKIRNNEDESKNMSDEDNDSEYTDAVNNKDGPQEFFDFLGGADSVFAVGNHLYFRTDVTDTTCSQLIDLIDEKNNNLRRLKFENDLKSVKPKPLYLHIKSFGGSLLDCHAVLDTIQNSAIPIYTVVEGYAASCGALMTVVGKKRFMTPSSYMLIHQLSAGSRGTYAQMADQFENCSAFMKKTKDIFLKHTKLTEQEIEECLKKDLYWDVEECMRRGLVDGIYTGENDN